MYSEILTKIDRIQALHDQAQARVDALARVATTDPLKFDPMALADAYGQLHAYWRVLFELRQVEMRRVG